MENFIVSARKYRPATFDMVVGQDNITNTLKNAIKSNHLAQAYLFCGPRGVGKTTCARIFAKTINCTNLNDKGEACDKCESCISFNSLRSFNIHELDAASNNKVEDIRSLNDQIRIPPQIGKYSVYIIDEVHMLSSSAFNAFLKTLEEPPSHAIFILATTEKHKIIPTILSRCQIFDFNRIRIDDIVKRLVYVAKNESVVAEEDALHTIAQKADGALRDALSIFDQIVSLCGKSISYKDVIENLNVLDYEYYFKTVDAAIDGNVSAVLRTFNEILDKGFDGHNFISGLNSHLRDLLVSKDESTLRLLEAAPSVKQRYLEQTSRCTIDFLYRALDTGSNCDISYKSSKNPRLHIELALIKMCRSGFESAGSAEKKKPDELNRSEQDKELPLPPKSEIIRESSSAEKRSEASRSNPAASHMPVIDKPVKSFSIRNIISETGEPEPETLKTSELSASEPGTPGVKEKLTIESLAVAWTEFSEGLKNEGPRIISMFKSIVPELDDERTLKIHLHNAAQKDLFVQNYKQRFALYLENRFESEGLDIETLVDQSETNEVIYGDDQKLAHLQSKYPILKDFKKAFNLDIS
jgi:DNA polymerase III subunit gamma/tau